MDINYNIEILKSTNGLKFNRSLKDKQTSHHETETRLQFSFRCVSRYLGFRKIKKLSSR